MSPFSILFGKQPSYDHVKVFRSLCYTSTLKSSKDKFQAQAVPCVFLGCPFGQKAYKLLTLKCIRGSPPGMLFFMKLISLINMLSAIQDLLFFLLIILLFFIILSSSLQHLQILLINLLLLLYQGQQVFLVLLCYQLEGLTATTRHLLIGMNMFEVMFSHCLLEMSL